MQHTAQSTSTSWENWTTQNATTAPTSQICSLSPATDDESPTSLSPHELSASEHANQKQAFQRRYWKQRQRNWQRKRQGTNAPNVNLISKARNRRRDKKSQSDKKLDMKNNTLKYLEEIKSLQQIGVAIPEVHNISTKEIPKDLLEPLTLGHKFIPAPKVNYKCIKDSMKYFTRSNRLKWHFRTDDPEENEISIYWIGKTWTPTKDQSHPMIEKSLLQLHSNIKKCKAKPFKNISETHLNNLQQLLSDPDIMIVTADKNLGYTITDIEWYKNACLEHLLSDSYINVTQEYYKNDLGETTKDTLYRKICDRVLSALENKFITQDEAIWICKVEKFQLSKFYILPKIHKKPPFKGRPIVPGMTWITFHLSEWISNQLNSLVTNICTDVLRDSTQLLQNISEINTQGIDTLQYYVLSADVEALYPNMDIKLGLTLIENFLIEIDWENQGKREFLLWALHTILTQGYIYFNGQVYQQTNGAAMGSPCIPSYSNIFMFMIERDLVKKYTTQSKLLLLYKRFIDDVFMICLRKPKEIATFQQEFNSINPKIKLTWTEPSFQTDFLDISIFLNHKNSKIETQTFQKTLNKYSYLPYHSFHTPSMKTGFIKGEAIRYAKSCSRRKDFNRMISLFTIRLQRRGYPLNFIKTSLKSVQYSQRNTYLNSTKNKNRRNTIPFLFKILYNHITPHHFLRTNLDLYSHQIKSNITDLPTSLQQKITICYQLPPTLHKRILKARKDKNL
jgi:hypothetical protein